MLPSYRNQSIDLLCNKSQKIILIIGTVILQLYKDCDTKKYANNLNTQENLPAGSFLFKVNNENT